jgi:hypothetical protein
MIISEGKNCIIGSDERSEQSKLENDWTHARSVYSKIKMEAALFWDNPQTVG